MKKVMISLLILTVFVSVFGETARVCTSTKSPTTYQKVDCLDNIENTNAENGKTAEIKSDKPLKKSFFEILGGVTAILVSYTFMGLVASSK